MLAVLASQNLESDYARVILLDRPTYKALDGGIEYVQQIVHYKQVESPQGPYLLATVLAKGLLFEAWAPGLQNQGTPISAGMVKQCPSAASFNSIVSLLNAF
jgi:hypothetical protein